jgi:hypothetical protein
MGIGNGDTRLQVTQLAQFGGFGCPATGNQYFVDPVNGSDGASGESPDEPLKTLTAAYNKTTDGGGDVVYLMSNGQASGTARLDATLVWDNDNTHLVGCGAPTRVAQRSRIATTSGTNFTPLITVSGDGCMFANLHAFHGYATAEAQICLNVTGERNYFWNCHFAGMGNATAGDQAGSASVSLTGDGENTFEQCTIGLDTVARSTTNAEIDFKSAAVRNQFIDCNIVAFADNAGHLFIKADTSGDLDRYNLFDRCRFINAVASTATTMTGATDVHASAGGMLIFNQCTLIGCDDWEAADSTNIYLAGHGQNPSGNLNTGIAHTLDVA